MKSIMKKLLIGLLVLAFSLSAASCSGAGITLKESVYAGGTHVYNYTETSGKLVDNGASDYKIAIPTDAGTKTLFASQELQTFFDEATGVTLPIVYESQVTAENDKFISLGKNSLFDGAGLSTDGLNLGYEGFIIKTVGDDIYIAGDYDKAALWGVYVFLELELNYEPFTNECYSLDKNVTNKALRNYDVVDIPDTKIRKSGSTWLSTDGLYRMRFDLQSEYAQYKLGPNTGAHTWNIHLDEDTDYAAHPKWYSTNKAHMCYNAQGDEAEWELLVQRLTEVIKGYFVTYPEGYIFTLGHGDEMTWCTCDTCADQLAHYGSRLVGGIWLLNEVATRIEEWLDTAEGAPYDREYYLCILSYGMTLEPPTIYNEATGKYEPIDDSVIMHEKVVPWYAPLEMDHQIEVYHKDNEAFVNQWLGWQALSDKMAFYTYSGNYYHIMTPVDMFQNIQQYYQLAAASDAIFISEDTITNPGTMSAWMVLRNYIVSKLGWNANLDVNELVDRFFTNYFGAASDAMSDFYQSFRIHSTHLEEHVFTTHGIYSNMTLPQYFPKDLLDQWLAYTEQAVKDISFYKYVDPTLYQMYYDHIAAERVSVQFLMIELYGDSYDQDYLLELKLQCKEDCTRLGISKVRGSTGDTMGAHFVSWGV